MPNRSKTPVATPIPLIPEQRKKRKLGPMDGKLTLEFRNDFEMTDAELLGKAAEADGVSRSDIIRDYLFVREFKSLRREMLPHAMAQGIYTDQDVFDRRP